jgi:hypothetical protein
MNLVRLITNPLPIIKQNAPEIFTALSMSGVVTTAYFTGKASYEVARDEDVDPWISKRDQIKRYWKLYIPAGLSGAFTIGCIFGASRAAGHRTAAAVTAYSLSERAFSEYKEKVVEQIGKGKEQKLRDEIAQDRVNKTPPREVIIAGTGAVLCCELFTQRYFRSDMETLRKAMNDINQRIHNNL